MTASFIFYGRLLGKGHAIAACCVVVLLSLILQAAGTVGVPAAIPAIPHRVATHDQNVREIRSLDDHWMLHVMPNFNVFKPTGVLDAGQLAKLRCPWPQGDWTRVQLPNDYLIAAKPSAQQRRSHGYMPNYPAWYFRKFTLPATDAGRTIWLNCGGAYRNAVVLINGKVVGQHASGYTAFRFDISPWVHFGVVNTLAVFIDPRWAEGWWYEGGGIYRHVRLMVVHRLHVAPWGTFVLSHVLGPIHYGLVDGDHANTVLTIQTTVVNTHSHGRSFTLISRIATHRGRHLATIASTERLGGKKTAIFTQDISLGDAALWSLRHPNLYHLQTVLREKSQTTDNRQTTFGIRTIRFDPDHGFFLDGRHVEIKGVCDHQDFPAVGNGAPDDLWPWRIAKLKAMGCNACRTAHNPMSRAFYRACNHMGMLVMDENRHLGDAWTPKSPPGTQYANLADLRSMVLQQRNDPCVIFWSMCNEENPLQGKPKGARIFSAMKALVHQLDPTRPVTCADNGNFSPQGIFAVEDLLGINYTCRSFAWVHRHFPAKMIFGSEDFNSFSARGVLKTSGKAGLCSEFGALLRSMPGFYSNHTPWRSWIPVAEHAYVAGDFIWTGFDYRGEPNPFGWPDVTSQTGAMDLCGFRKPNYYYWRAWWQIAASVYIFPAWTYPAAAIGKLVRVRCYSNCSRVQLLLNGKSLGTKPMPPYKFIYWRIPYAPGVLVAKGYEGNREVARYSCRTAGPASKLQLIDQVPNLSADGQSVAPIAVTVLDARGTPEPYATNRVHFSISGLGTIVGVGNGNPAYHGSVVAHNIRAFAGKCMVMVRVGDKPGLIHLVATSKGLAQAVITIQTH